MKGNFVPTKDDIFRRECHRNGDIDRVAAEKCFISKESFCDWRNRRGLKPNGLRRG